MWHRPLFECDISQKVCIPVLSILGTGTMERNWVKDESVMNDAANGGVDDEAALEMALEVPYLESESDLS